MNIYNDFYVYVSSVAKKIGIKDTDIINKITCEPPKEKEHGDISTNLALIGSKYLKTKPLELAGIVQSELNKNKLIYKTMIAKPGFINMFIKEEVWHKCCKKVLCEPNFYGKNNLGKNKKVNIEFVSANPTGPIHIGHARGAVFGDSLANILEFSGYDVTREYYINDAGEQINILARSVYARYLELLGVKVFDYTSDFYPGEYLISVAQNILTSYGKKFINKKEEVWLEVFKKKSIECMLKNIKDDLSDLKINHDIFVSEESIIRSGKIEQVISLLKKKKLVYEGTLEPPKGGAAKRWEVRKQLLFKSTEFGDDLDRPLTKSNGSWTYFASDSAYHYEKCKRKFDTLINIWGADHGGYIKRINGIIKAVSNSKINFEVKLCQLVNVVKDGEQQKMSKREGNFVSLREVIDEIGADVLRFIMLTRKNDASLDFDIKKVSQFSNENPVYYVQYAHARIRSLIKKAELQGFKNLNFVESSDYSLLKHPSEIQLMKLISTWPRIIELSAKAHEPHRITYFLNELAAEFHHFWSLGNTNSKLRYIIPENKNLTLARLSIAESLRVVISVGLNLIGVKPLEELK